MEEEQRVKESQKLKEIEVQKSETKKMQQTFGLESILEEIEEKHKAKDVQALINYSSKCVFLFSLMEDLQKNGHRTLIFSMSKKFLNLIEDIIGADPSYKEKFKYLRIDGDTEIMSRESICQEFNNDPSIFCCLLTTKVGGFGLNLTGANRVVILDPDWNPANDNQAVDRVCRIGQKRDVIVYRLVTIGGIEEKIYRRQIFKRGINLQTIETSETAGNSAASSNNDLMKYFNDSDLFELFEFNYSDPKKCETLSLLLDRDGFNVSKTPTVDSHLAYLRRLQAEGKITGLSVNSNLYSKGGAAEQQEDSSVELNSQDIKNIDSNSTDEDKASANKGAAH